MYSWKSRLGNGEQGNCQIFVFTALTDTGFVQKIAFFVNNQYNPRELLKSILLENPEHWLASLSKEH